LAALHDSGEAAIVDIHVMPLPGFPAKMKAKFRTADIHVFVAEGRETERFIVAGVFRVADADETDFQEANEGREHFCSRHASQRQIFGGAPADSSKRLCKRGHPRVFRFIADFAPPWMI